MTCSSKILRWCVELAVLLVYCCPSGTIHALGAGVVVAEVQTPSDTTFRVYDWAKEYGRTGRELHVSQTLACTDFGPPPPLARLESGVAQGRLVTTEFFRVDEWRLKPGEARPLASRPAGAQVLTVLAGRGTLSGPGFSPVSVETGRTLLVPAALLQHSVLTASGELSLLLTDVS